MSSLGRAQIYMCIGMERLMPVKGGLWRETGKGDAGQIRPRRSRVMVRGP